MLCFFLVLGRGGEEGRKKEDKEEKDEDELVYGASDLEKVDYNTDDENDYEDDADDEEDDGQDVTPLLNPDENIAQWKAVKAKPGYRGLYRSFNVFYISAYDLVRRKAIGSRGKKE
ncbi:BnaA09g16130D [Brassica napus]|uniref:BnaA09g16130D protein n=1 Tax=Brassica napus TaxID=3708 RepID=A0A078IQX7_BRANA|nr:BnaA09g16130D [Brassica napus]